jgi:transposase InsO family protein
VIEKYHVASGHAGLAKTLQRIQDYYIWPGMRAQVKKAITKCGLCAVNYRGRVHTEMGEMPIARCPGEIVGIDLIGPLFKSHKENRYLLVAIDHFSGWIEAYPLKRKTNDEVQEKLAGDYVPRHGAPRILITDQGNEFRTEEFESWLSANGIERRRTSGYNPQSNGKTERANGTLRRMLEKLVNGKMADWEDRLGPALTAVRNNVSSVTGHTPFYLHYARPCRHSVGRMVDGSLENEFSHRVRLQAEVMAQAARATEDSRRYNRERLAAKANAGTLEVGDHVVIQGQRRTPLTARWDHNFVVTAVQGKVVTVLHTPTGKTQRWNRNKVRLVNPEISWEGVTPRPKVQTKRARLPSTLQKRRRRCGISAPEEDPEDPEEPEDPEYPDQDPEPEEEPPRRVTRSITRRQTWAQEQAEVLCFCAAWFQQC